MNLKYEMNSSLFCNIPGYIFCYWGSAKFINNFNNFHFLNEFALPVEGIKTGDNDKYLRLWFEVDRNKEFLNHNDLSSYWRKIAKGGDFRRWYGNLEYVCFWDDNGRELKNDKKATISNIHLFFSNSLTWTYFTSGKFSMRIGDNDMLYNNKGPACYVLKEVDEYQLLSFFNSVVCQYYLDALAPTVDYKPGNLNYLPFYINEEESNILSNIAKDNVNVCKLDWDFFESSWNFNKHPLI